MRDFNHVTADGKREIFGLSRKIREKAWHSTTIDCDEEMAANISTNRRGSFKNRSFNGFPSSHKEKNSASASFEDRLRNILPSDVESIDERLSSVINISDNIDHNHNIPRSYEEHMVMTKQRKVYGMNYSDMNQFNNRDIDPRQRRCESAVPASFMEDWNVVENPKSNSKASTLKTNRQQHRPSLSQIEAWNQRPRHAPMNGVKTLSVPIKKTNLFEHRYLTDKYLDTKSAETKSSEIGVDQRKNSMQSSGTEILEFDWSNDTNEGEFSRSGTPILPPLSPVASEDEENAHKNESTKSVHNKEDWHREMSPTESAMDTQERNKSLALQNHHHNGIVHSTPKNDASKPSRRHHRRKKHRNRNNTTPPSSAVVYYDDTNFKREKNYIKKRNPKFDVYVDQEEIFETASVHTNHSMTSSVVRRSTRRHHRNALVNADYEKGIRAVNKRFSRLESHVITLAQSVTQLSLDVTNTDATSSIISELQNQLNQVQRQSQEGKMVGFHPTKSYQKLTKFFGEEPPVLHFFLQKLGYEKYIPNFDKEDVGIVELPYLDEDKLKSLGIPMGPRVRIMEEAKKLAFV